MNNNNINKGVYVNNSNIERDLNINRNKIEQNQSNIDKSKKYTLNTENMIMAWANPYNPEAVLYRRLPNINDRPMMEKYYNMFKIVNEYGIDEYNITEKMIFYGYVVKKRSELKYVVINLIDEFGTKMAAHTIIQNYDLSKYLNKVIKFTGVIYKYNEEDESSEIKYGVTILKDYEIKVIEGQEHTLDISPWNMIHEDNPNVFIKVEDINNKFNKLDINAQLDLLYNVEEKLNVISMNMFNVPNLIYPIILTNFLMRDDIYDEKILSYNIRHLNILMTIVIDYILGIKPNSFDELMKVVIYVILNYLGYDLNKPAERDRFYEFIDFMGIERSNAKTYLINAKQNAGGVQAILDYIPEAYKTKPGDLHEIATIQFVKRIYIELDL